MAEAPDDKQKQASADTVAAAPVAAPAVPKAPSQEKSWGDKYKHKAHHFVRNVLVNYVVNFAISAVFTYKMENTKFWKAWVEPKRDQLSASIDRLTNHAIDKKFTDTAANLFSTTQLLLVGGHSILPYMKWSHDNRQRQEFEMGNRLDKLQEFLGKGNAASKRNLEEYKYINDLLKSNKPANLTIEDKMLLANHNIDDSLQFKEHRQTWGQVVKARLTGMAATSSLSFALATGSYFAEQKKLPNLDIKTKVLKGWGGDLGEKIYSKLSKLGMDKKGMRELGFLTVLESIYTAASKFGFDRMEKRQLFKQERADQLEAQAALKGDKEMLAQAGIRPDDAGDIQALIQTSKAALPRSRPTALEARNRILEEGGAKDFRERAALRSNEPVMALGG